MSRRGLDAVTMDTATLIFLFLSVTIATCGPARPAQRPLTSRNYGNIAQRERPQGDRPYVEHHGEHEEVTHHGNNKCHREHTYMFQISGEFGAYEYLDSDDALKGFNPDFIKKVCEKAGKTCFWMYDTFTNCWKTSGGSELPGQGLLDGWYDGCIGLYPTPARKNSFNFTTAFTTPIRSVLRFRGDRGPTTNLMGLRIGFGDGWSLSPACLQRQEGFHGNKPGDFEERFYSGMDTMLTALNDGEVHAVLTDYDLEFHSAEDKEHFSHPFSCTDQGCTVMANYGSEVIEWWNEAVADMVHSGEYEEFCEHARAIHGNHGHIHCLDTHSDHEVMHHGSQ